MRAWLATAVAVGSMATCSAVADAHPGHTAPAAWSSAGVRSLVQPTPTAAPPFTTGVPLREPPVVRSVDGTVAGLPADPLVSALAAAIAARL